MARNDLKNQLKAWQEHKKDVAEELRDLDKEARHARVQADDDRRRLAEGVRLTTDQTAAEDDGELSDEELFQRALDGMRSGSDAILKKYDRTDAPRRPAPEGGGKSGRVTHSDQALFLQAVGEMSTDDVERMKPATTQERKAADARFARRVRSGEVQPENILDLHGDDRTRALDRTKTFLEAEAKARTEVVLIVHGKGAGVLGGEVLRLLDEHPLVVEHLVAPRDLGGEGARVARLRSARKKTRP